VTSQKPSGNIFVRPF